jgi:hypothetical protein
VWNQDKALWSYTCTKFQKSYKPPAARIRVKAKEAVVSGSGGDKENFGESRRKLMIKKHLPPQLSS